MAQAVAARPRAQACPGSRPTASRRRRSDRNRSSAQRHLTMPAADVARLLLLAGLWGGSFVFIRVAVAGLGPVWLAFSRVTLAFATLFVLALVQRAVPPYRGAGGANLGAGPLISPCLFGLKPFPERYLGP